MFVLSRSLHLVVLLSELGNDKNRTLGHYVEGFLDTTLASILSRLYICVTPNARERERGREIIIYADIFIYGVNETIQNQFIIP